MQITKEVEQSNNEPAFATRYGGWIALGIVLAMITLGAYSLVRDETTREMNARRAQAVVLEKQFSPANRQSSSGIYYPDGNGGSYPIDFGSTPRDRWIVVVRATEGAQGIRAVEVSKNLYYRIKPDQVLSIIIKRGGLGDAEKYTVEIDEGSVPAPFAEPTPNAGAGLTDFPPDDLTNAKGQIRR